VNYANPDMVGHTGDLQAAIRACEAVDKGLGRAARRAWQVGGAMIVTADHGNCETMIDPRRAGPTPRIRSTRFRSSSSAGPGGRHAADPGGLAIWPPRLLD
jgi:2,3-bisphosphoglycerate-independent phosphoglycerate mutase